MDKGRQFPAKALLKWLSESAPLGILVTDSELKITLVNKWFEKNLVSAPNNVVGCYLFDLVPDLKSRGFERYYKRAVAGETRVFSHRFHRYLIPMTPSVRETQFALMQQSATVFPLMDDGGVVGTVTVIEDVTERVFRENELNTQIMERDTLLLKERLAAELSEENSELKRDNKSLKAEGTEILEAARLRDKFIQQIIVSQEEERKRVARNIHDHLGQELTALRFALTALEMDLNNGRDPSERFDKCKTLANAIDSEVSFLSGELRPMGLDDLGLVQALAQFIEGWSVHFGIPAELHSSGVDDIELPYGVAINIYRIAQEALNNISKHSKASLANVLIEHQDGLVTLIIEDNGVGFNAEKPKKNGSQQGGGMGLVGMRERAALIQSTLELESKGGRGTTIFLRVPLVGKKEKMRATR